VGRRKDNHQAGREERNRILIIRPLEIYGLLGGVGAGGVAAGGVAAGGVAAGGVAAAPPIAPVPAPIAAHSQPPTDHPRERLHRHRPKRRTLFYVRNRQVRTL